MSLKVIISTHGPLAEADLVGELDAESARVLRLKCQSLIATGHPHVVLDLTDLGEVDDAGVAILAYARRIYRLAGGSLSMVGLGPELDARLAVVEAAHAVAELRRHTKRGL